MIMLRSPQEECHIPGWNEHLPPLSIMFNRKTQKKSVDTLALLLVLAAIFSLIFQSILFAAFSSPCFSCYLYEVHSGLCSILSPPLEVSGGQSSREALESKSI